jgi:hypothetical protein
VKREESRKKIALVSSLGAHFQRMKIKQLKSDRKPKGR